MQIQPWDRISRRQHSAQLQLCVPQVTTTGVTYRRLGVPKLEEMLGRGLFYGAGVNEGPAMRGRKVFVVGGANSAG